MSELQLSDQLIKSVLDTLILHDQGTKDDGVALQYLAAITGFIVGRQNIPPPEKQEFLEQLSAFSVQVMKDVSTSSDQNQPAPPPPQEAFGIWKPGDN